MGIWLIWFIVAIGVIATKYYTARTVTHINLKLAEREKYLSNAKLENKTIKSNLEIAKRALGAARRKIEETIELIEKAKPELTELKELEQREMEVARDLIEKMKERS